jgi:hypothetical protein
VHRRADEHDTPARLEFFGPSEATVQLLPFQRAAKAPRAE